ncbi:MAG: hypothetical protein IKV35_03745 [Clostridia bacterium]|nr:hypothetical protein [Clostridia bacterium]
MQKPDKAVLGNTAYIAAFTVILSAMMEAVFLMIGKWDWFVLFGNLLGAAAAVGNFFIMGMTVQKAVTKEQKEARDLIRLSQALRLLGLVVIGVLGAALPCFNILAVLIPLFFPRIAIMLYPLVHRKEEDPS